MSDTNSSLSDEEMEDLNDWLGRYEQSRTRDWFSKPLDLQDEYEHLCEGCGRSLPCRYCAE